MSIKRILMKTGGYQYIPTGKKGIRHYYKGGIFPVDDPVLVKLLLSAGGVEVDDKGKEIAEDAPSRSEPAKPKPAKAPAPVTK